MPGTQEEDGKNAAANQRYDQFNQALIELLAEELRYRFQCRIDQWNRENWFSSMFNANPFQESLTRFNLAYLKITGSDQVPLIQAQADAIVKAAEKLIYPDGPNSFSNSVKAIFKKQKITPVSDGENIAEIDDPVVEQCLQ
ncbi:MAG: hypothetical protein KBD83_03485, partial [Gammaproteobacteria bacterium]|nr:hypothetical protein [Gammaproteobacteria bacterium]